MKKFFICLFICCLFRYPVHAFEGVHQRDGEFLVYAKNEEKPTLIHATHISTVWESGFSVYYTKTDGTQFKITRSNKENYEQVQIISIEPTDFTLLVDCYAHSYPVEAKGYRTGEMIPAGDYKINQYSAGWYGILKEDGTTVWVCPNRDEEYEYVSGKRATFTNTNEVLSANYVNGIPVYTNYLIKNMNNSVRPGYAMKPLYVTIHNTDNSDAGANALSHAKSQYNNQNNDDIWVSWHFQVDKDSIYQSIPINETAWHAGDGTMMGNSSTIGIEICENSDGNYAQAEKNAAYLTAQILFEVGLPSNAVKMHKDWSGKDCAKNIIKGTKSSMGWDNFKALVQNYYEQLEEEAHQQEIVEIDEEFKSMIALTSYQSEGDILYNIPINTFVTDLVNAFNQEHLEISVLNHNDEIVTDGILMSGYKMKLTYTKEIINEETQEVSEEIKECTLRLSIKGDINGDGKISSMDYVYLKNHILGIKRIYGAYNKSADVNGDNKTSSMDYVLIKNHILKISSIQ